MKAITKLVASAGLALATVGATAPATAQVQGNIASSSIPRAVINTTAFQSGYNQVAQAYASQLESRTAKQQQLNTLIQPFDTNGDGNFDENELRTVQGSPNFTQIQTLETEIAAINAQVNSARIFVTEQILAQYPVSLREVMTAQSIVAVFNPETIQAAGPNFDITNLVTTSLNTKVPQVSAVPPAEYRPSRQGAAIYQEIQQVLISQAMQQQAAAQQQQAPGNTQAPQGR